MREAGVYSRSNSVAEYLRQVIAFLSQLRVHEDARAMRVLERVTGIEPA